MKEQYENLTNFKEIITDLDDALSSIKDKDLQNLKDLDNDLLELHRIITTLEWHFSEVGELNTKVLKSIK